MTFKIKNKGIKTLLIALVILVLGGSVWFFGYRVFFDYPEKQRPQVNLESETFLLKGQELELWLAVRPREKQLGLGGLEELPPNHGMLFVFSEPGYHRIWMKDMNFPIDIIWLDSKKKITEIKPDITPDTYPKSFKPQQPAKYILELPAGWSKTHNLKPNDALLLKPENGRDISDQD